MTIPSPVSAWTFENTTDDQIGTRHVIATTSGFAYGAGVQGLGAGTDGTATEVQLDDFAGSPFAPLPAPYTFTMWVYLLSTGISTAGFSMTNSDQTDYYGIYCTFENEQSSAVCFSSSAMAYQNLPNAPETWVFVAGCVRDDGSTWVSVNGAAPTADATTGTVSDATWVYMNAQGNAPSLTLFDECLLFDVELEPSDLVWLYNGGAGRTLADVLAGGGEPETPPETEGTSGAIHSPRATGAIGAVQATGTISGVRSTGSIP